MTLTIKPEHDINDNLVQAHNTTQNMTTECHIYLYNSEISPAISAILFFNFAGLVILIWGPKLKRISQSHGVSGAVKVTFTNPFF